LLRLKGDSKRSEPAWDLDGSIAPNVEFDQGRPLLSCGNRAGRERLRLCLAERSA
jgi:hypothetical protein